MWRSLDGGRIFTAPVAAVQHRFVDHPSLAVGNRPNNVATVDDQSDRPDVTYALSR